MMPAAPYPQQGRARPFGEIARNILRNKKFRQKGKYGALVDAWQQAVGEGIAARTRIRSFRAGKLVVEVDSSVLLHEMRSFMEQQILSQLQQAPGGRDVAELRLRLGAGQD
jgi:hypothetical protein